MANNVSPTAKETGGSQAVMEKKLRVAPGHPYPLGATWDGLGVNFALFSENATQVELCLFNAVDDTKETHRIVLPEYTHQVWHGYIPDLLPGQLYGYRVSGPYDPENGQRFNPNKVLIDPYAKAIGRKLEWDNSLFAYEMGSDRQDLSFDEHDNAAYAPLGEVIDPAFTWGNDRPPRTPWHKTIIYETHVKGLTKNHPEISPEARGTYSGLGSEPMIQYLKGLGVTAVELLPIHHYVDDRFLVDKDLSNYWGYNTLSFFAPETKYTLEHDRLNAVNEFKMMVRSLHAAGIEVILDVVYNHTAEGNQMGPTFSFRGIDNGAYYRLEADQPRYYSDFTGCGNTLNMRHPRVLQLIMDSLRYWIEEMHVDGFRFDLASALARELHAVDKLGAFFDIIQQDPIISQVKLIAEPWDLGEGGYQVGNFPVLWTEWNGKYRDTIRQYWKGDGGQLSEFATRFTGSSDLYEYSNRQPHASINFITCHDGFTLNDLVSYNDKHNDANCEDNRDGESHNNSWNCGAEGETDDPEIIKLRARQRRNFLATLILSIGVPMISGGDEFGRTQKGNNNTYGQDNELSWYDWKLAERNKGLIDFVQLVIRIRKEQPVLQRRKFFTGSGKRPEMQDIYWFGADGQEMEESDWNNGENRALGIVMNGTVMNEMDETGRQITGDSILVLVNAHYEDVSFTLPAFMGHLQWELLLDTSEDVTTRSNWISDHPYDLCSRAMAVFRLEQDDSKAESLSGTKP